ncbi:uncharacterized protein LOC121857378 [Homarus americanus]|nr:uncharacterized protein LOC121857378 [Homarus americanus]
MAGKAFKSIVKRMKPREKQDQGADLFSSSQGVFEEVQLRQHSRRHCSEDAKRFTVNLGVEDLSAVPRPESMARFYTDDDLGVISRRRSSLRLGSTSDNEEDLTPFLLREYLRKENAERYGSSEDMKAGTRRQDKENKLWERKKSLIVLPEEGNLKEGHEEDSMRGLIQRTRDGLYLSLPHTEKCLMSDPVCMGFGVVEELYPSAPLTRLESKRQDMRLSLTTTHNLVGSGIEGVPTSTDLTRALVEGGIEGVPTSIDLTPVAPPRRKRDARKRAMNWNSDSGSSSTPGTPQSFTMSTPGTPQSLVMSTPGTPQSLVMSTPGTPQSLATSTPGTPQSLVMSTQALLRASPCQRQALLRASPCQRQALLRASPCQRQALLRASSCQRQALLRASPCQRQALSEPRHVNARHSSEPRHVNARHSSEPRHVNARHSSEPRHVNARHSSEPQSITAHSTTSSSPS